MTDYRICPQCHKALCKCLPSAAQREAVSSTYGHLPPETVLVPASVRQRTGGLPPEALDSMELLARLRDGTPWTDLRVHLLCGATRRLGGYAWLREKTPGHYQKRLLPEAVAAALPAFLARGGVLLHMHNHAHRPIGSVVEARVDAVGLCIQAVVAPSVPVSWAWHEFDIGYRVLEEDADVVTALELLEISFVFASPPRHPKVLTDVDPLWISVGVPRKAMEQRVAARLALRAHAVWFDFGLHSLSHPITEDSRLLRENPPDPQAIRAYEAWFRGSPAIHAFLLRQNGTDPFVVFHHRDPNTNRWQRSDEVP